ncbi:MAG: DNA polymerase [Pseudomonadota bacterium]
METVTYKTHLKTPKPFLTASKEAYLQMLEAEKDNLYYGNTGIYLSREIHIGNQKLYFLFLDIDGDKKLTGDAKIQSAVQNMYLTYRVLKSLEVENDFNFIATGGHGFRAASSLLLDRDDYKAFVEFIKCEMTHIHDIGPIENIEMPYQLLSYKGNPRQINKTPIDRHSVVIPHTMLEKDLITVVDYKKMTQGKPDPNAFIEFSQSFFFNFQQITDLAALNGLGEKLKEYRNLNQLFHMNTFEYIKTKQSQAPISLEVMQEMLQEKGIYSKIAPKGKNLAISFDGLPCPSCGKTTGNAGAFPPNYSLKCFSTNCAAHREKGGLPLHEWSGIESGETLDESNPPSSALIKLPEFYVSRAQAHEMIRSELTSYDNSLLLITPGVGKTHVTIEYLAQSGTDKKVIIYSSYNKALQQESYQKAKELSLNPDKFFLLKPKMDLCKVPQKLKDVVMRGFSPAEILCSKCEYKSKCSYYEQRKDLGPGIYFVTHKMLEYLESILPRPDLIILDENIQSGFLNEDTCGELEMRTLYSVLNKIDFQFIKQIIDLGHSIGDPIRGSQSHPLLVNGRKITDADYNEDTVISLLATLMDKSEIEVIKRIQHLVLTIKGYKRTELYNKGVNLKAFNWLKGLLSHDKFSLIFITSLGELLFKIKSIIPLKYYKTPTKVLDATGNEKILKAILKREIKTVQADVKWNSHKTHIIINTAGKYVKNGTDEDLRKLLTRMIDKICSEKVMVITYKDIKKTVLKLCKEIDSSKSFMDYHFIGPRGVNVFENCDAVLVLGLPYPNLNDSGHDAFILFPDKKDADIREDWVISIMQWELLQNIHRIRPVNKASVEIVIASSFWPPILGEPDIKDDSSTKSYNWKETAISKLEPFVKEFGFFNADIGFLAGVFTDSKANAANNFKNNLKDLLHAHFLLTKTNSENSHLYLGRDINTSPDTLLRTSTIETLENNLIIVIRNIYYNNLVSTGGILPELIFSNSFVKKQIFHGDNKILSNSTQLTELIIYFKEQYSHFESFELKLSHSRGHYTKGVGIKKKVSDFYKELNDYKIFGNTPIDSYKVNVPSIKIDPIPENYIIIYVPDNNSVLVYFGIGDTLLTVNTENGFNDFENILGDKQIITNNGKYLALKLLERGQSLSNCIKITDIVLNEKIISNGIIEVKQIDLPYIFKKYEFHNDPDITLGTRQIFDSWIEQDKAINKYGLSSTIELESRLIWVTAKIEFAGMEIDAVGILSHQESIQDSIVKVEQEIRKLIPSKIPLSNMAKIKSFINKTFRLNLLSINKDAVNTVNDTRVKNLISQIVEYNRLIKDNRDIRKYIALVNGGDDRARDEIQQINTKTGRFYRELQTVKKKGLMRSFFIAAPGYKLVITDYSQQEARIIAGLANDQNLINIFKQGKDIYAEVAKVIFKGSSLNPSAQRKIAKEIVVGINNGRTEYSIHPELTKSGLMVSLPDIQAFIDQYMRSFPNLFKWLNKTVRDSRDNGYVTTRACRRMDVSNSTKTKSIINFPVQGTGADGFKLALWMLDEKLRDLDARIVHILHDEIIVEAKADIADKVEGIVKSCMEKAFVDILPEVPMSVTPITRNTWGEI